MSFHRLVRIQGRSEFLIVTSIVQSIYLTFFLFKYIFYSLRDSCTNSLNLGHPVYEGRFASTYLINCSKLFGLVPIAFDKGIFNYSSFQAWRPLSYNLCASIYHKVSIHLVESVRSIIFAK